MATVKVKFRASSVPAREGALFYQVIHNRVARQVNTGYKLYPYEWDAASAAVVFPPGIEDSRRNYLVSLKETLREDTGRLKNVILRLEKTGKDYTAEEVVKYYLSPPDTGGIISFARDTVRQLKQVGKPRTAERYATVMNSFGRFLGDSDVPLDEVDSDLMIRYENFLKSSGVCPNTSSYYMRGLRAVYNRAVEKELTVQRSPFKHVYTGIDKTVKRAVPLKIIRQIRDLDLTLFRHGLFTGYLHVLVLHQRDVVHRHGLPEKEGPAKRDTLLPQAEDGTAAFHQVGKTHAGDRGQVRHERDPLPAADNQGHERG